MENRSAECRFPLFGQDMEVFDANIQKHATQMFEAKHLPEDETKESLARVEALLTK